MHTHKIMASLLAIVFSSCAAVTTQSESPAFEGTVVEIPAVDDGPAQHVLTGTYEAGETIHFPKCITLEGTTGSIFVGKLNPDGEQTGFQIEFIVEDAVATVSARELQNGKVVAREEHLIPVEDS